MGRKGSTGRWEKRSDEQGGWKNAEMCPKSSESLRISREVLSPLNFHFRKIIKVKVQKNKLKYDTRR